MQIGVPKTSDKDFFLNDKNRACLVYILLGINTSRSSTVETFKYRTILIMAIISVIYDRDR